MRRVALWLLLPCIAAPAAMAQDSPDPERQAQLVRMVRQDCGACHGLRLTGGLGPALTAEALAGRTDEDIVSAILDGRPGAAMPGWRAMLNEAESGWIARRLKQGFPEEGAGGRR
jgi:cytochrome c55X